jgi:hypothetical protein
MFKSMTLNFEMDKLDQVLSHFVGSSLNATCIVILAEKEKKLESKLAAKKIASKQDMKIAKLKQELAAAENAKKTGAACC